jgi:hypothetical protein
MTCTDTPDAERKPGTSFYMFEYHDVELDQWFVVETLDFLNDEIAYVCRCGGVHWIYKSGIKAALHRKQLRLLSELPL